MVGPSRRFSNSCIGCDLIPSPLRPIQDQSVKLTNIYNFCRMYIQLKRGKPMAVALTSIRLDKRLADEAAEVLGVKSRTEAVHAALREIVALKRFKKLMSKYGGKLDFSGHDE